MASWGDVETYEQMISDLGEFMKQVNEACQVMTISAKQCAEELDDVSSLKACSSVLNSVKQYQVAMDMTEKLIVALRREEEDLIELIRKAEALDGE